MPSRSGSFLHNRHVQRAFKCIADQRQQCSDMKLGAIQWCLRKSSTPYSRRGCSSIAFEPWLCTSTSGSDTAWQRALTTTSSKSYMMTPAMKASREYSGWELKCVAEGAQLLVPMVSFVIQHYRTWNTGGESCMAKYGRIHIKSWVEHLHRFLAWCIPVGLCWPSRTSLQILDAIMGWDSQ